VDVGNPKLKLGENEKVVSNVATVRTLNDLEEKLPDP
jgi:hypothetical protein